MAQYDTNPIESLLRDPNVFEIDINAPDSIYYWDNDRGRMEFDGHFESEAHVRQLAEQLAATENVALGFQNPIAEVRLGDGTRILAIVPPVSPNTVIRILRPHPYDLTLDRIAGDQIRSISQDGAAFLKASVKVGANIVAIGGSWSGKTHLLHMLYQHVPEQARVVSIQPMSGFRVSHKNRVVLETRNADLSGEGAITAAQLMRHIEVLRPDRLILSDLQGDEFPQVLDYLTVGGRGMFAMEGTSSRDALARLETFATRGNLSRPLRVIREEIVRALDLIVHISLMDTGLRRVVTIDEVADVRNDTIELKTIFEYDLDSDTVLPTGYVPQVMQRIKNHHTPIDLSEDIFVVE